jgi:hypothetical protein
MAKRRRTLTAYQLKRHAYWMQMISQWQASGLSGIDFCRRHKLPFRQLSKWKIRLTNPSDSTPDTTGDFIEVRSSALNSVYEIITPGNYRIRIEGDYQPETLSGILSVVSRVC